MKNPTNPVILWSQIKPQLNQPLAPCASELKRGLDMRTQHPLHTGLYKLREAQHAMGKCLDEFELLSHLFRTKQPLKGNCTYGDHTPWIKERPLRIAFELGWKVLPAIEALTGDGISREEVARYLTVFIQRVADLVIQCDQVLPSIKGPIRHEYERWMNHGSIVTPLLESGLWIIESAMNMTMEDSFT